MAENTKIEWADHTFNPWEGCTKVGPGCDHCYAEARNARFGGGQSVNWGSGAPRRRTSESNWHQPIKWNAEAARLGVRYRVFCASLADVFDNEVDPAWRSDLFSLIQKTPNLDWLLLTKRIGNAAKMIDDAASELEQWPVEWLSSGRLVIPNVWLGATICNQAEADRDIPKLLAVPAAKRFLSMEPLLGHVTLGREYLAAKFGEYPFKGLPREHRTTVLDRLDWVIVGGESGHHARPMHPDWARSLRDQCQAAGVPFLFKQWGEFMPPESSTTSYPKSDWRDVVEATGKTRPVAYRGDAVLESSRQVVRVGKKAAGRELDGRTWDEVPA